MTTKEWFKAKKAIRNMANMQGITIEQARMLMETYIDEAWKHVWTPGNLNDQVTWQKLFPDGKKPTVEQYIVAMGRKLSAGEDVTYIFD